MVFKNSLLTQTNKVHLAAIDIELNLISAFYYYKPLHFSRTTYKPFLKAISSLRPNLKNLSRDFDLSSAQIWLVPL